MNCGPDAIRAYAKIVTGPNAEGVRARLLECADAWAAEVQAERGISGDLAIENGRLRQRLEAAERAYAWQVENVRQEGGVMLPLDEAIAALAEPEP